ncbi:MAG TPA: succinyldiaminopimelate transaminase [Mycobacteriales bacterium]|nr:succinyldiaminopimelate transaminase [Mycobacteriales bacterium]
MQLPDFPWDRLAPAAQRAREHPDGIVDLSVGTPVDATPKVVQDALVDAADAPGYPFTAGTEELRAAAAGWLQRRFGAEVPPAAVLPVIGTKELVAWLPTLLGASSVGFPALAYPTYDVGARIAGASSRTVEALTSLGPQRLHLLWINSPANPTGRVLPPDHLRKVVDWCRERGTVLASDECYADLWYDDEPPASVLSPAVCGTSYDGVLAVHSLSKRSNLAGYRAGFVAGDPALVARLLEIRKHAGMIVPAPVQAAMVAALSDDEHVVAQRSVYAERRLSLLRAFEGAGFVVEGSAAGLYLWATRGEDCWSSVDWLADRGILVAPGEFYGPTGRQHVRVALTATDERVAAAVGRLTGSS